jgi:hypothetical protein
MDFTTFVVRSSIFFEKVFARAQQIIKYFVCTAI